MNEVPRTFCITLKETPLRTRSFNDSAKTAGVTAELFYGVFGKKLGMIPKYPNILESSNSEIFMTEGAVGCVFSHLTLWKALSILPENEFMVLEDDALFTEGFKDKFHSLYIKLPSNWEFVYVGWIPYGNDMIPVKVEEGISIQLPSATHAYLVKKSVLERLVDATYPIQSPLDLTLINKVLPTINYYVFDPSLVGQKSYENTSDSMWASLVYDWKNDLYNCKKKLMREVSLDEGWHLSEENETEVWRWSKDRFTINVPKSIDSLSIVCSVPFSNEIIITVGGHENKLPLKVGTNEISVITYGETLISGVVTNPFVPSEKSSDTDDPRVLGICLKRLIMKMGVVTIPIEFSDLSPALSPPLKF
jgi:GR25 family glycosyltransferase involved in LPS biosynthesis